MVKRVGDLEINEDLGFQRRMWAFQRVGWGSDGAGSVGGAVRALRSGATEHQREGR